MCVCTFQCVKSIVILVVSSFMFTKNVLFICFVEPNIIWRITSTYGTIPLSVFLEKKALLRQKLALTFECGVNGNDDSEGRSHL